MARQVNICEAALSQLAEDAAKGEEIAIAKIGKPTKLGDAPLADEPKKRQFGQFAHLVDPSDKRTREEWLRDWQKLDEEILQDFECLQEEPGEYDSEWSATSSTPTRSSGSKRSLSGSSAKRSKK